MVWTSRGEVEDTNLNGKRSGVEGKIEGEGREEGRRLFLFPSPAADGGEGPG